ncbi:type II toxin-antitoxin system RelB family antitoxin, partial [Pseudostreptobacillus sp.]
MSVISIRFNDEEENIIKKYAKAKGFSLSQLIKETLIEKIEEEYDLEICKEYL